jgi:pyrroloquinoline quinone (PQQ) biosynthesis protein C
MSFYEALAKATEPQRRRLYTVPQLDAALRGKITRDLYIAYLTEAYHHVSHTVPFLMSMGSRLPEEKKWLLKPIANYISEEIGHEDWILNDIDAAGGDREAARRAAPNRETAELVAYNYDYIRRKNPVGFLGMVYMLESTSVDVATHGAETVMGVLNLPKSAFTYLLSHGALDVGHMKFFESLVNRIEDEGDRSAIIEVAQTTFLLFAEVLRSLRPFAMEDRHAA